jgi:hypothetical protein
VTVETSAMIYRHMIVSRRQNCPISRPRAQGLTLNRRDWNGKRPPLVNPVSPVDGLPRYSPSLLVHAPSRCSSLAASLLSLVAGRPDARGIPRRRWRRRGAMAYVWLTTLSISASTSTSTRDRPQSVWNRGVAASLLTCGPAH